MGFDSKTKGRNWVVTIQVSNMKKAGLSEEQYKNPQFVAEFFVNLWENSKEDRKAGIVVCESKEGLYHCHMACVGNTTTLKKVSDILFQSHVEPQVGGKEQLLAYLNKEGKYAEKGENVLYRQGLENVQSVQGKRNDLDDIEDLLRQGLNPRQIFEISIKYRRYEKIIRSAYQDIRFKETDRIKVMNNEYHWGDTNTGKTYTYIKLCEKLSDDNVYLCGDYTNFGSGGGFDMYADTLAEVIFLDEFRGQIPYHQMLAILDVYRNHQVHCRYQNVHALWTSVIVCSILSIEEAYEIMIQGANKDVDTIKQFTRRFNKIVYHYVEDGEYKTFSMSPKEYINKDDMIQRAMQNKWISAENTPF